MLRTRHTPVQARHCGFSLIELVVTMFVFLVVSAVAIPNSIKMLQSYRAAADAKSIASQLSLARMRAASDFTQTQLNCNLSSNSCQLQVCTTKGVSTCTGWSAEGGAMLLSPGDSFGFGTITAAAGTQTTIQNTASIVFNSRGIPIDTTGAATANDALYLTDQAGHSFAVSVYASGQIKVWQYAASAWMVR